MLSGAMRIDLSTYDPTDPATQQDPFPHYARLREEAPVFRHPTTGLFFVSSLDAVREVLADTATFSSNFASRSGTTSSERVIDELRAIAAEGYPPVDTMLTADPPLQTRYRKTVGRAFTTKRIQSMEPVLRKLCRELLSAWPEAGEVDCQRTLATPFPVQSIARVLGMNPAVEGEIKRWSDASVATIGVALDDDQQIEAARGVLEMQQYWADEFEQRLAEPRDDFLTALTKSHIEDASGEVRALEMAEMLSIIQQLMVAGNETTTKLINEMLMMLARRPDLWKRLREDLSLAPAYVEESLRLATPNQGMFRQVREDTKLAGVDVPKGSTVWVIFGSANRDERTFPSPDEFDPDRENVRDHVAFGQGAHFCIGAPLARLEAKIALEEVAKRVEKLELPEQPPSSTDASAWVVSAK